MKDMLIRINIKVEVLSSANEGVAALIWFDPNDIEHTLNFNADGGTYVFTVIAGNTRALAAIPFKIEI